MQNVSNTGVAFNAKSIISREFDAEGRTSTPCALETPECRPATKTWKCSWTRSERKAREAHAKPFLGGSLQKVPMVQIKNGKISQWSDYYDQLKSRRCGVAASFTGWIEL